MKIKVHYNWIDENDSNPEYSNFEELVNYINHYTAFIGKFYKKIAAKCKEISDDCGKAYNALDKNILTNSDFDDLKIGLLVTGSKSSEFFKGGVVDEKLIKKAEESFDTDFDCIKAGIISIYKSNETELNKKYINEIVSKISNCKTLEELISLIRTYYNTDSYSRGIISIVVDYFSAYFKNLSNVLNELVETHNEKRSVIKKLSKLVNKSVVIDFALIREMQKNYENSSINLEKTFSREVIDEYNKAVMIKSQKSLLVSESKAINNKIIETREDRIRKYKENNTKKDLFIDAGEITLSKEEMECLNIYLDVIKGLDEEDIERFENKTTNYLVELLENEPYPANLINKLVDEVDTSTDIDYSYKKRIKKAVSHLK